MPQSSRIHFASSNRSKYDEAKQILLAFNIELEYFECNLVEIQSDSIKEIVSKKAKDAMELCCNPVIVDDTGLFIDSLGGFPGPFSSYVQKTIGNQGVLQLLGTNLDRSATFHTAIAFQSSKTTGPVIHTGCNSGKISSKICGKNWGYDPIFIPDGYKNTLAEIKDKNEISSRALALCSLAKYLQSKK